MSNAVAVFVILTGDFVTVRAEHAWPCADVLRRVDSPLGCFAVLCNHDYDTNAEMVAEALSNGFRIRFCGIGRLLWSGRDLNAEHARQICRLQILLI
jgi:predicted MPP superfamily phosphohydrolase